MLFPRRKRQDIAAFPIKIGRFADKTAWHFAHDFSFRIVFNGEKADIRPAETDRIAERLRFADHDVRAQLTGRRKQTERHRLGDSDDEQRAMFMRNRGDSGKVFDAAEKVRRLDDDARGLIRNLRSQRGEINAAIGGKADFVQGNAGLFGVGAGDLTVIGMQRGGDQRLRSVVDALRHQNRFRHRRRAVVHRGVRRVHAGQLANQRLKFENRLQCALRDFRLIGRVSGQKFAA